jgi:uncharacterized membrane protein
MLNFIGSYRFIGVQATLVTAYVLFQLYSPYRFDPFPFILLNLGLSLEASFLTVLVLRAQNRSAARDREIAEQTLAKIEKVGAKILDELDEE